MRRFLIISAALIGGLAIVTTVTAGFLLYTGPGRNIILSIAENELGEELASDVTIGAMTGSPLNRATLHDVRFADSEGIWLEITQADLVWRPFALINKRVDIETLAVNGARLLRPPPENEDEPDNRPLLTRLQDELPFIRVNNLSLANIVTELAGETEVLEASGALNIGGNKVDADLTLTSSNERDSIALFVDFDPDQNLFDLNATIESQPAGVITTLAGLDGTLSLSAFNDTPLLDLNVKLAGQFGDLGTAEGTLVQTDSGVLVDLDLVPGDTFATRPELSQPVQTRFLIREDRTRGSLNISNIKSAAGDLLGKITWTYRGDLVDAVDIDLDLALAPDYQPLLHERFGQDLKIAGNIKRQRNRYGVDLAITGDHGAVAIANGLSNLRSTLEGDFSVSQNLVENPDETSARNISLNARLAADIDTEASLSSLSIVSADGSSAVGRAAYSFVDQTLAVNADIEVQPDTLAALIENIDASESVTGEIEVTGAIDQFTLTSTIETPALDVAGTPAAPLRAEIALAGLPSLPVGDVAIEPRDPSINGAFNMLLRSSPERGIAAPSISYTGDGFSLTGAAAFNPETTTAQFDATYQGEENATPWPGTTLLGDLELSGRIAPNDDQSALSLKSQSLWVNTTSIKDLLLDADGALDALALDLDIRSISSNASELITNVKGNVLVDLTDAKNITLSQFEGLAGGSAVALTAPAEISFGDGIAVSNLAMTEGDSGSIAIDGTFKANRWQASANLQNVNIPYADGKATINLELDTDAPQPATGSFQLRSLLLVGPEGTVSGDFNWDGENVLVRSDNTNGNPAALRATIPAKLVKAPALSVDTTGNVDGAFDYDGDIRALAPYSPPALQSLEGGLIANFTLQGSLSAPELAGSAAMSNGAYTEIRSGFSLTNLHFTATANHNGNDSRVEFNGGGRGVRQVDTDTITFDGGVILAEESSVRLNARLDNAELAATPVSKARLNGDIEVSGSLTELYASGEISIDELDAEIITPENTGLVDIDVVTYDDESPENLIVPTGPTLFTAFDISLTADDRIFIRGRGLESEWSASVNAENTQSGPLVVGQLNLLRGSLDFSGRRFEIVQGGIFFDRLSANNPRLDIRAEYETSDGVTAIISISGRANEPSVELSSTPSMPSENIMALILFGKQAEELSAVESLQTAQALATLGGVGPFGGQGITGTLRQAVGLDLLNIDIDPENGGGSLTVGKYVADGFFVSATQDISGQDSSVRVEYEIIDNLTIETDIEQDGDQTVSANWKHDF